MADVSAALKDWSSTSNSNSPSGATNISTGLDDNLREIQGSIVRGLSHKGADIASAGTTDLGAVEGLMHDITGTTTITGFGTVRAGIWKILKFEGALTLTHNATSLILLLGANRTTANGDVGIYISEGSGNWREVAFWGITPVAPTAVADTSTTQIATTAFVIGQAASQALMELGASATAYVTPARAQFHQSAAKFWIKWDTTGTTVAANYNVTSVTNTGTGNETITIGTDFATGDWCFLGTANSSNSGDATAGRHVATGNQGGGTIVVLISDGANPEAFSDAVCFGAGYGDQA
jgi:hypothetical protein